MSVQPSSTISFGYNGSELPPENSLHEVFVAPNQLPTLGIQKLIQELQSQPPLSTQDTSLNKLVSDIQEINPSVLDALLKVLHNNQ